MQEIQTLATVGERVLIRGRRWRVAWIAPHRGCSSIHVAADDPQIGSATFLYPFDDVQPVPRSAAPRKISRGKAVAALRSALMDSVPFPGLMAAAAASIDLLPYQLEPALALVGGAATRVLIADDVGLGKTIQAGIAMSELVLRNEANHVLVIVPAGLVDQWIEELRSRFALGARHANAAWLRAMSRTLPPWVSPWTVPGVLLISIDLLKRREVLAQIENVVWDLVVIDEAHRATGGTDRHRVASHVCARARRVVLLTATPHAGDARAFRQIQELGAIPHDDTRTLTFARTRAAVLPDAVRRRARYFRVRPTAEERAMHAALDRYAARMWRAGRASSGEAVRLAMMVLKKRALSAAFSLHRSLVRRLASIDEPADTPAQLGLSFDSDPSGESVADDEEPGPVIEADRARVLPGERAQLRRLIALASAAATRESKVAALRSVLARTREPVIIFTEYRDTLEHLAAEIVPIATPVLLHGGLAPDARRAAVSAFTHGGARVLIATDAAAEGLNLHKRCRWVVNLELPWAPLRLIQRAGRVDRIGQSRRVHAWHFVAGGTDETRLLLSLAERAEAADSALARERAISEQTMAAALIDADDPCRFDLDPPARLVPPNLQHARDEKARLETVRALGAAGRPHGSSRAGVATVKRRRGFTRYHSRDVLLIIAGRALDPHGCPIARRHGVSRSSRAETPVNELEPQLRGDVRRYEQSTAVAARRRRAIYSLLVQSRGEVQPALFDRRALDARDVTAGALARAGRQLDAAGPPNPGDAPPCEPPRHEPSSIVFDLVAGFEVT